MKFSIVIPTYNRADIIAKSLDSICNQTYTNWEIIVVDNASTDNTAELMADYVKRGNIRYIVNEKNYERSYSRNRGMQLATGDFVSLLDSDDILYPDCLQKAADFIQSNPDTIFFHCLYEILGEDYKPIRRDPFPPVTNPFKAIAKGNFISNIGVFYRKDLLKQVKFDETPILIGVEDYDFVLNTILHTGKVERVNEFVCGIYDHPTRSVYLEQWDKTYKRITYFLNKQDNNPLFKEKMGRYRNSFHAHIYLYLATFSAMRKKTVRAFKFIFKAFFKYPAIITEYTFWKHIFVAIKRMF
ncbi:MAG TPA: glycosyltransferase family 2 protein [Chitinophagaceae bacterium]|nr:glycosyltransferase family 2 protein [Chitinophagaceae bacterium]